MENQPISNQKDFQQLNNNPIEQNISPKKQASLLFPVLITLLISAIVFGFGGYYYGSSVNQVSNLETESISITDSRSNIPSPSPKSSDISLINYVHPEKMYKLEYPSGFIVKENKLGENQNSACHTELILAGSEEELNEKYQGNIVVDVCKVAEQFFPDSQFSNIGGSEATQITLNGNNTYVKSGELDAFKLGSKFQVKRVTTYKNGYAYTFDLRHIPNSPDYSDEFDQILSSFVITN